MNDDHDVTLGEVYRRLDDIDKRHGGSLNRIDAHLGALNSKVATHERMHAEGNIRVASIEREVFGAKNDRALRRVEADEARRDREEAKRDGIVINVPTNGRTIAALLMALMTLLAAWKAGGL